MHAAGERALLVPSLVCGAVWRPVARRGHFALGRSLGNLVWARALVALRLVGRFLFHFDAEEKVGRSGAYRRLVACMLASGHLLVFLAQRFCAGDRLMVKFMRVSMQRQYPFRAKLSLEPDLERAIAWISERSAEAVNAAREQIMSQIEAAGRELVANGACEKWFADAGADDQIRKVR